MSKITLSLLLSLLASSAYAQSGASVASSAGTDAVRPPPPASASAKSSAGTDASPKKAPAAAAVDSSAGTDASKRLIPQPRKDKQRPDAADASKDTGK